MPFLRKPRPTLSITQMLDRRPHPADMTPANCFTSKTPEQRPDMFASLILGALDG